MTKEKAIDVLIDIATEIDDFCHGAKHWRDKDKEELEALDMAIKALKEQSKEGEWIESRGLWKYRICSETENRATKYCPNCGSRMKGADDE